MPVRHEKGFQMTTLDISAPDELRLTLHGATENVILATLRRWPHWQSAELERDPDNTNQYLTVTLITSRSHEATIRDILKCGFGMVFPREGGSIAFVPPQPRRSKTVRRS